MTAALLMSLALTEALELPFAYVWGLRGRHDLILCALVNLLTNPAVVLTYILLHAETGWPRFAVQLPLEMLAVTVEAVCYARCGEKIRHPVLLSVCANAFSYTAGFALAVLF